METNIMCAAVKQKTPLPNGTGNIFYPRVAAGYAMFLGLVLDAALGTNTRWPRIWTRPP